MPKALTIIMVARNHFEQTEKAIRSLVEFTDPNDVDLIFFDQSDADEGARTSGFVQNICVNAGIACKYIASRNNVGFVAAVNHCLNLVESEFVLTAHNDVVFSRLWLRNMMRRFKNKNVAAVGPVITFALGQQSVNIAYQTLGYKVKFLLGLFFMCRMDVWRQVKKEYYDDKEWYPSEYGMGDKEELELSYLIRDLGYKLEIARDVLIQHEGEKSFVDLLGSQQAFYDYQNEKLKLIKERLGESTVNDLFKIEPERPFKVMIGVMTRTNYTHCYFTFALMGIWGATQVNKQLFHIPRGHVAMSRNKIIEETLKDGSFTHVLFVDDDMVFENDALSRLLQHDEDIITGQAYQRSKPFAPCIFKADFEKKFITPLDIDKAGVVEIDACGGYFLLIKTDVLRQIQAPWFRYEDTSLGFNDKGIDGKEATGIGEDVYFGIKAKLNGFKLYADTDLEIGHIGYEEIVKRKQFEAFRKETNGTFVVTDDTLKM